jgi:uncharacterized membrane protein
MPPDLYIIVRWVHVLAAAAWYGEVAVMNFVLIPTLSGHRGAARKDFLNAVFPRVFRMASILSATVAITGGVLLYHHTGGDLRILVENPWGKFILVGGALGLLLTLFHFFMENRLARRVGVGDPDLPLEAVEDVHLKLRVVPRLGFLVLTIIFVLMMIAVRGV